MERIMITKYDLNILENQMRLIKHIDRYFLIRQFCYGTVLDVATGCGYGSSIISTNPTVTKVIGIDMDKDSIDFARKEYSNEKIIFIDSSIEEFNPPKVDVLVSIETIEHISDPKLLAQIANTSDATEIIISYPTKVSTNYNIFHKYDFVRGDIEKIFDKYRIINIIELGLEVEILIMTKDYSGVQRKLYGV